MKMRFLSLLITGFFILFSLNCLYGQDSTKTKSENETIEHGQHFIDKDGDGYNDNAPDHDGDGIPNGLDPDWQNMNKENRSRQRFVDLDGDGINDNLDSKDATQMEEGNNLHQLKKGSSLESKSKEEQQRQQKKQRGKP